MQAKKFLIGCLCISILVSGCKGLEPYVINAPENLDEEIAKYKAEKEAENVLPDDAVAIEVSPSVVGAEDNTSGWWTAWSQYFTIPSAKKLTVNFINYSGEGNWNNWVLATTTPAERGAAGYAEYFVLRADNYGWGDGNYDGARISLDIDGSAPGDDSWWAVFREKMNGATATAVIDHASEGTAYLSVVATALDGSVITETYNHPVSFSDDINVFFVADAAHIKIENAFLSPSDYPVLPDSDPVSITVTGAPLSIPYGEAEPDYWGNAVATVTFEDGSSLAVPKEELNITEPDLSVPGTKTVVVTYSYSKKGVLVKKPAAGYYTFELVADLESLDIVSAPVANTYYYYENQALAFRPYGMALEARYAGGVTIPVAFDDEKLTISPIEIKEGEQTVTFTYKPGSEAISTSTTVNTVKGGFALGVPTLDSAWWTYFAPNLTVPAGQSASYEMDVYSVAAENWQAPVAILRKADNTEYAVVRIDNYGWGDGYATASLTSDWNWELFKPMLTNAHVKITATNHGDGTADVRYDVLWANGETHFQQYSGITVTDAADVTLSVTVDNCYAVFIPGDYDVPGSDPEDPTRIVNLEASAQTYLIGGAKYISMSKDNVQVYAIHADESKSFLSAGYSVSDSFTAVRDGVVGTYQAAYTVSYTPMGGTAIVADGTLVVSQSSQAGQTTRVGDDDYSGGWWSETEGYLTISKDWTVAAGESQSVSLTLGSDGAGNWHSPSVVLRKADGTEYLVVRMDNFGWGTAYDACTKTSNWDWDVFAARLNGSKIGITVTVGTNNVASIRYHVIDGAGETHFQYYDNIAVDGADVQFAVATEGAYMDFD